jgi:hypothetical protein
MSNHYHLVIETPDGNLSKGMRQLNGVYTQAFNRTHRRVGHIFQGRYKAILIDKESHLLEVCRYVVLNPVRARIVSYPDAWQWSSYRSTAGLDRTHACLSSEWILGQFGRAGKAAQTQYRQFVKAGIGNKSVWTGLKGQSILGREQFVEVFAEYLEGKRDIREIPRSQRYLARPTLAALFGTGVKTKKERDGKVIEGVRRYGYSQQEIAKHLGLHYTTISRIIHDECYK